MSGSDTSRGMNFQYACAIRFLIAFPLHPEWQTIQMEGDKDIEDIVIFNPKGAAVIRAQIKQKSDPYRFGLLTKGLT